MNDNIYATPYLNFVKDTLPSNPVKAFIADLDRLDAHIKHKIAYRVFRSKDQDAFEELWFRPLYTEAPEPHMALIATRFLSNDDDIGAAERLVLAWCQKHSLSPPETVIRSALTEADKATASKREYFKAKKQEEKEKVKHTKTKGQVIAFLAKRSAYPLEIADALGKDRKTIQKALERMWKNGLLDKADGLYTLKPEAMPVPPAPKPPKIAKPPVKLNDRNWVLANSKNWKPKQKLGSLTCWGCRAGKCEAHGVGV